MSIFKRMLENSIKTLTNPVKMLGSPGLKRRAGLFAAYMGGGYGFSYAMDRQIEHSRNYYGAERFAQEYGEGANMPGNLAKYGVGWLMGGMSLIDRDYISRGRNTYRYLFGEGSKYSKLLKRKSPITRTALTDGGYSTMRVTEPFSKSQHPIVMSRRKSAQAKLQKLKDAPQFGLLQMLSFSSIVAGGSMSSGLANVMSSPQMGTIGYGVGALGILGAGIALQARGKLGHAVTGLGVIGAGGYAGLKAGQRPMGGAAEGNIIDFSDYNNSAVRRMNFSTAGLPIAIERGRRKFYD